MSEKVVGSEGFSADERRAMKERAAELRSAARSERGAQKAAADRDAMLEKIAAMAQPDRGMAERIHDVVMGAVPTLTPKTWYGQPAYAKAGKVICFFRSGQGDGQRYSTFGFTADANLDHSEGMWPTSFALAVLTDSAERTIVELVVKAAG